MQTYNSAPLPKVLRPAGHLVAVVLAVALLLPVGVSHADDNSFGFSKLAPPKSKFRIPGLGDISIWKNDMQKAKQAYRDGKYAKAMKYFQKARKNGNFLAAWYLGHIYRLGLGVPVNPGKAFHLYREVAVEYDDHGLPPRMFLIVLDSLVRVADGYRSGIKSDGIKRDYRRAMRLYSKAARRGHPAAQFGLANMYLTGQSVKRNPKKAVRWIRLAARKRFPPALAQLGEFSIQGKYMRKSKIRAVAMYIIATQGTNEAHYPHIFDRLDQLSRQLTDEEYQRAKNLADRWMKANRLQRTRGRVLRRPAPAQQATDQSQDNARNRLYQPAGQPVISPGN